MSRLSRLFQDSSLFLTGKRQLDQTLQQQIQKKSFNKFVLPKLPDGDGIFGAWRMDWFKQQDDKMEMEREQRQKLQTRIQLSTNPLRDIGFSNGDAKLRKIRYWLNNLGEWVRSADQQLFHEHFLIACLPHIYGKDWNANGARVMASLGIDKIDYEVLCQTPRRFGKTVSVAMFVAVLALCCPGIKISVFSTGSRASKSMVDHILKFCYHCKENRGIERKIKHSKEELMFSAQWLGARGGPGSALARNAEHLEDTTVIKSYPASVDSKFEKHNSLFILLSTILYWINIYRLVSRI
jgi:hypothetical protein